METFGIELKKYHDVFLANLMLALKLNLERTQIENYSEFITKCELPKYIVLLINNFDLPKKDKSLSSDDEYKKVLISATSQKVIDNLGKLRSTSENFLNSILNGDMNMDGVSGIIKKIFTAISANYDLLKNKDPKIFQLKTLKENGKQVTMTIVPGLDIIYSWYCLNNEDRDNLWFYLENMFVSGTKMIHLVNETSINNFDTKMLKELNYTRLNKNFQEKFPEQTVINTMNLDIDPFLGVGQSNVQNFGVEDMLVAANEIATPQAPGIGSMAKMLGVDKMFNMDELSKQLKNINKSEIDEATKNIQKLLGSNVDENTSNMIGSILSDITDHLKNEDIGNGDPIQNIINIAEKVAQKAMPKIDTNKVDMKKIFESTQNLANNYKDENGNPILNGKNNPLAMLSSMMQGQMQGQMQGKMSDKDQMKMAQEMMKNLSKQINNQKKFNK